MTDPLLSVAGLQARYGESQVLFDVTLEVGHAQVVTLLGRNGMGKTTTVASIMGLLPSRTGSILFQGETLQRLPAYRIAQRGLGLVPEGRRIFPNLTVRENLVATAANRAGRASPWTLAEVLSLFPSLQARVGSLGGLLSGGEQQMLAIGRALMTNPALLILDEATEGLAPLIRVEIWRVLDLLKARGQSILLIDKNVAAIARIANRHYILEKGRIVWSGDSSALLADGALRSRYLGV